MKNTKDTSRIILYILSSLFSCINTVIAYVEKDYVKTSVFFITSLFVIFYTLELLLYKTSKCYEWNIAKSFWYLVIAISSAVFFVSVFSHFALLLRLPFLGLSLVFLFLSIDEVRVRKYRLQICNNVLTDIHIQKLFLGLTPKYAFSCKSNKFDVIIPTSVVSIENKVFMLWDCLFSVQIPETMKHIGDDTFYGCENVILFVIKDSYAHKYAIQNNLKYKLQV